MEWLGLWIGLVMVIQQGEQEVICMLVTQILGLLEALLPKSAIEDKAVTQYCLFQRKVQVGPAGLLFALFLVAVRALTLFD